MKSVEQLRAAISAAERSESERTRRPTWLTDSRSIGVARDRNARLELFLVAPELHARSRAIRNHLSVNRWGQTAGDPFTAARIVVPGAEHFVSVLALIAAELLRHGYENDPQAAFLRAEPLIELALLQAGIGEEATLGLLGELFLLEKLLVRSKRSVGCRAALERWQGFGRSARDFISETVAIEVKATTNHASEHSISSIRQVSPDNSPSGRPNRLYLFSVGFVLTDSLGRSVATQTEAVLDLLLADTPQDQQAEARILFLDRVAQYGMPGVGNSGGYDHNTMRDWPIYARQWDVAFNRLYEMGDQEILIPRSRELAVFQHLVPDSIRFDIKLPNSIRGDANPVKHAEEVLDELLAEC